MLSVQGTGVANAHYFSRLGELLMTPDLATLVDGGGVQVDRWPCCLSTV